MSLRSYQLSFLAIKPRREEVDGTLVISSSWVAQSLTLMGFARKVVVDPKREVLTLFHRFLWMGHRTVEVPFDRIKCIRYIYDSWTTDWSFFTGRLDGWDFYKIKLELKNPSDEIHLFTIWGEGSYETGLKGVLLGGDKWVDFHGDQDQASLGLVESLMAFTGKPLG